MIFNHLHTYGKNFKSESHDMKIDILVRMFEGVRIVLEP